VIAVTIATIAAAANQGQACDHEGHDHGTDAQGTWRGTMLHAIPLWSALVFGPQGGLGSQAVVMSAAWMPTGEPPPLFLPDFLAPFHASPRSSGTPLVQGTLADVSVPMHLDLHRLYQPGAFLGVVDVVVIGKLMPGMDETLSKPEYRPLEAPVDGAHGTLYRFVMICCAADARPAQVLVFGQPPPSNLAHDSWVEVQGRWLRPAAGGLAGIIVDRWQVIPTPAEEYLTPY